MLKSFDFLSKKHLFTTVAVNLFNNKSFMLIQAVRLLHLTLTTEKVYLLD